MKTLQVAPLFPPNPAGLGMHVRELCLQLARLGHESDILTINSEGVESVEELSDGVTVYRCRLDARYGGGYFSLELARRLLQARRYDLLHLHIPFYLHFETAAVAGKLSRRPLVATHHGQGTFSGTLYRLAKKAAVLVANGVTSRLLDRLIFFTADYAATLKLPRAVQRKIRVVRPSIDLSLFSPEVEGADKRRTLGLGPEDKVIMFAGQLRPEFNNKRVDHLITTLAKIRRQVERAKLLVVGDGPLLADLREHARKLGLADAVVFAGAVPHEEVPRYYAACDVYASASINESFCFPLLEAQACGKPVVAYALPGQRENIEHDRTGFAVPPGDLEALGDAVARLLGDPELYSRMSAECVEQMRRHSWERSARETLAVYEEVL